MEVPVGVVSESAPVGGCEQWRPLIAQYGWDVNVAMAVMQAESGCRSDAVGDDYPIAGVHARSCGLLQIRSLSGRPTCEELKDPQTNVAFAWKLYQARGWQPWSAHNNGSYLKYLQ